MNKFSSSFEREDPGVPSPRFADKGGVQLKTNLRADLRLDGSLRQVFGNRDWLSF